MSQASHFLRSVDKALEKVKKILDNTRQPRLAHEDPGDHTYEDKFALVEFIANTGIAAKINVLQRLGLDNEKLEQVLKWVHEEKQSVTLRFEAQETCSFLRENIVTLTPNTHTEYETTTTRAGSFRGVASSSTETTRTKVTTKVKEHHWKIGLNHRLVLFKGSNPESDSCLELCSRNASSVLVTAAGQATPAKSSQEPRAPIRNRTVRTPDDVDLTWLFENLSATQQLSCFSIDRDSAEARKMCKTPRRNKDVDGAICFDMKFSEWAHRTRNFFLCHLEKEIIGKHNPMILPDGQTTDPLSDSHQNVSLLSEISDETVFVPILPLMEDGSVLSMGDVDAFLSEHTRSIDEAIANLSKTYPPRQLMKLATVAEATMVFALLHIRHLTKCCIGGFAYVEDMLKQQLVQAIGKEVDSKQFDEFMRYHQQQLFGPTYAPRPFSYAIRRPHHYPDGMLSIEAEAEDRSPLPIDTWVRHIPGGTDIPPIVLPISAATQVELKGDCFLHGWMQHRFGSSGNMSSFRLAARARQFSSFLLVVGHMSGPGKLDPKDAIVLQNKDEVLIPLLTETLPSAKDFKDAISSLSPEQREFAKSFRTMQLSSSVFGLCVIQLKPQLEHLLGLPNGALTKEIQLTQDLMSLFVEYQIPSDLLTFEGDERLSAAEKVTAVKGYVAAVMNVIDNEKKKQLENEVMKADMRAEMFDEEEVEEEACEFDMFAGDCLQSCALGGELDPALPLASVAADSVVRRSSYGPTLDGPALEANRSHTAPPVCDASLAESAALDRASTAARKTADAGGGQAVASPSSFAIDFTAIPKLLDARFEQYDTDNSLHSTTIKASRDWIRRRQANLLTEPQQVNLSGSDIETEKKKAFDLLDAISRSGTLPIVSSELHVVIAVSHCFTHDVMGTVIEDNINPIVKVEKSSLLVASTVFGKAPTSLITGEHEQRLTTSFPELLTVNGENESE